LKNTADTRVNITVTNVLGQSIYKETFSATNGELDQHIALPNNIANGTYLVNLASGDQNVVFHMVVNR
ncbi:MAG: hypothetical protein JWQ38_851, partial [Flavipsychrobacter sp.]|nr:hypothetical protein [Flavipsychrobacter sp.]